jgi:integrase
MVRKVREWRDSRASTPRAADIGITVLRALLEFGRQRAAVHINVAEGIGKLYQGASRAEIVWTDEDVERFSAKAAELHQPLIVDGLRLAALTGLRRADLVTVTWAHVGEFAVIKKALKTSRGKRRFATMPRIPELDGLLHELKQRQRQPGVETLLVNSYGRPWSADGFGGTFNRVRDAAGIVYTDPETGLTKRKHLHDLRGTFATKLIMHGAGLTDQEVAEIMGWAPEQVAAIRRVYVDQARVIVAIGQRIRGAL